MLLTTSTRGKRMNRFVAALSRISAALAVAIALAAAPIVAQTGTVTGTITDAANGAGIQSVQVYLVDTGLGTLTNASGRFLILNVPAGSYTVRAERLGFATQDIEVTVSGGGTTAQNFAMESEALGLDELVVTGTAGAARRREIGNTIASVSVADIAEPPQNVDALLQGRVAGMTVLNASGNAGSGARIRLRGNVSVAQSNQPLIYVDGVRIRSTAFDKNVPPTGYPGRSGNDVASPLNSINPADIDRIEVIKGAAATTLYGTEAAAGVIQIFTKRGHTGAPQWVASMEQGISSMQAFGVDNSIRDDVSAAGGTPAYMFIDPWLRNAHQQRYALSVSGGGEDLQYFVSGSMEDDEGVLPNDEEQKTTIRGNFTFSPAENLQLQWNTSFMNDEFSNTAAGNNAHGLTLNVYRRTANYFGNEEKDNLDKLLGQDSRTQIDQFITGGTVTYSPTANFTNRLNIGYDLAQQNNRNLRPFGFIRAPNGILSDGRSEFETLTFDYVGTLSFGLGMGINSSLSFGGQSITEEIQRTTAYAENFPGPGDPTVTTGGTRLGFEQRQRVVNAGFFAQNVFDIADKYFITAGFRVDGNSAFGSDFGLQFYPKISGSWVVSDEDFWGDSGQLKLRAAWGQSGRAPGAFDAVRTYTGVGWGNAPAFFPGVLGNPELGPERTAEFEFGFDGSFFSDRVQLDFTYYDQKTTDALFNVRQQPSNGFSSSQLENVGEISNKGMEITLNTALFESDSWAWDLGVSYSSNNSEVGLPEEVPEFSTGGGWIIDGQPAPVMYGECVTNPDAIAEPVIDDECVIGPNMPTDIFGINTSFSLPAGMTLSARGEYQGGHGVPAGVAHNAVRRSVVWAGCNEVYTIAGEAPLRMTSPGRNNLTALQRAKCTPGLSDYDLWTEKANFFKIRDITLQVPVSASLVPGSSGATLTLSGRNVFRWTNSEWTHFDPEMGGNNDNNPISRNGASSGAFLVTSISEHIPAPATYTVALRVVF